MMRSISSSEMALLVRSFDFVVLVYS